MYWLLRSRVFGGNKVSERARLILLTGFMVICANAQTQTPPNVSQVLMWSTPALVRESVRNTRPALSLMPTQ